MDKKSCIVLLFSTFISLFVLSVSVEQGGTSAKTTTVPLISKSSSEQAILNISNTNKTVEAEAALLPEENEPRDFGITLLTTVLLGSLLLLPILGIAFIALFVPLPAIYFPQGSIPSYNSTNVLVTGRRGKNVLLEQIEKLPESISSLRGMFESDICVQRISCEIMRASAGLHIDEWMLGMMNEIPVGPDLKWKINRATKSIWNCKRFVCDPMSSMWKIFTNS